MTPTEIYDWRKYMEQRHSELRADYYGPDGNSGFKKDVQNALFELQKKDERDEGFKAGIQATLSLQNKLFLAVIALLGIAISLLAYYGNREKGHQGLFSLTHSDTIVARDAGLFKGD